MMTAESPLVRHHNFTWHVEDVLRRVGGRKVTYNDLERIARASLRDGGCLQPSTSMVENLAYAAWLQVP